MSDIRTGQCLCGTVKVTATLPKPEFQACHCVQCQRWTGGGPYLAVWVQDLQIEGDETLRRYRASKWGERATCATCGSIVYWTMQGRAPAYIALGLLDDQSGLTLTHEIFVDHRPEWLRPEPGATQSTEAQELAELQAWLDKNS